MGELSFIDIPIPHKHEVATQIHVVRHFRKKLAFARIELFVYRRYIRRVLKIDGKANRNRCNYGLRRRILDNAELPEHWDAFFAEQIAEIPLLLGVTEDEPIKRATRKKPVQDNPKTLPPPNAVTESRKTSSASTAKSQSKKVKTTTKNISIVGKLINNGWEKRTSIGDYTHYFVDVSVENLGGVMQRIWGNDLQRALEKAKVDKGDRIQVTHVGERPVRVPKKEKNGDGHEETNWQVKTLKVYEVIKLH